MERVRITRRVDGAPKTWEFAKTKGTDADKWQVTPEGGQAADADAAKVDALLNALTALRLGTFAAPTARTGLDAPVLSAAISYDGGKFERGASAPSAIASTAIARGSRRPASWTRQPSTPCSRRWTRRWHRRRPHCCRSGCGSSEAVRFPVGERAVILTLVTALAAGACSSRARSAPPAAPAPATPPTTTPVQAPPPNPPHATTLLYQELATIFGRSSVAHAQLAVSVTSLTVGDTLFSLNERRMMVPASNQKLLTVAAAARKLGWDYRYTTRVLATGPVKADGTLDGDLVIVGSGDPTINPRHPDRWAVLDAWAGQVAGARREGDQRSPHRRRQCLCRARSWLGMVVGRPRHRLRLADRRAAVQREPGGAAGRARHDGRRRRHRLDVADGQRPAGGQPGGHRRGRSADARHHRAHAGLEHAHGARAGGARRQAAPGASRRWRTRR